LFASAVNSEGEQIHSVSESRLHRATNRSTEKQTGQRNRNELGNPRQFERRHLVLFALLAGTGCDREAVALKSIDLSPDCPRSLVGEASAWSRTTTENPKLISEIDIAELCPTFTGIFKRQSGYLLRQRAATTTTTECASCIARHSKKVGFHAFRRFRTESCASACTGGPNQVVARTLENTGLILRRRAEQRRSVAIGMVRPRGAWFFLSWATWATKFLAY